jgi:hypothetical protein
MQQLFQSHLKFESFPQTQSLSLVANFIGGLQISTQKAPINLSL